MHVNKTIKTLLACMALYSMLFTLAGCTKKPDSNNGASNQNTNGSSSSSEHLTSGSEPSTAAPAEITGVYYEVSYVPDNKDYAHRITFNSDNSFTLIVNLTEAMGKITGQYSVNEKTIECIVDTVDFSGFTGDNVTDFSFTITDENHLVYHGIIIAALEEGNIFEKNRFS